MSTLLLPHQKRVVAERDNLMERLGKLTDFIAGPIFKQMPEVDQYLLCSQHQAMSEYERILGKRISRFEPEADDDFELGTACDLSGEGECEACQ